MQGSREIRYNLTADASQILSALEAVAAKAKAEGKDIDKALSGGFGQLTKSLKRDLIPAVDALNNQLSITKGLMSGVGSRSQVYNVQAQAKAMTALQSATSRYNRDLLQTRASSPFAALGQQIREMGASWSDLDRATRKSLGDSARAELFGDQRSTRKAGGAQISAVIDASHANQDLTKSVDQYSKSAKKATKSGGSLIATISRGATIGILASTVIFELTSALGQAGAQADALYTLPRILEQVGIPARETAQSVRYLQQQLEELPTVASSLTPLIQQIASLTGNVAGATEISLALNNAVLAGAADAQTQANAMRQLEELYRGGTLTALEFRGVQQAMPMQLNAVAKALGVTTDGLRKGLADGSISIKDFTEVMVRFNKEGLGALPSLADQAKLAASGLTSQMMLLHKQLVTSLQEGIETIGVENLIRAIKAFGEVLKGAITIVVVFGRLITLISDQLRPLGKVMDGLGISAYKVGQFLSFLGTAMLITSGMAKLGAGMWTAFAARIGHSAYVAWFATTQQLGLANATTLAAKAAIVGRGAAAGLGAGLLMAAKSATALIARMLPAIALMYIFYKLLGKETPKLEQMDAGVGGVTSGLENLNNGLDDTSKSAKKTFKQLAAFDKMNVLEKPDDSGGGGDDSGISAPSIDTSGLDGLNDAFKDIDNQLKLNELTWKDWAILIGSLVGSLFLKTIPGLVNSLFSTIGKKLSGIGPAIVNFFKGIPGAISKVFAAVGPRVAAVFKGIGPAIRGAVTRVGSVMISGFQNIIPRVVSVFQSLPGMIGRALLAIGPAIMKAVPTILRTVGVALTRVVGLIPGWGWAIAAAITAAMLVVLNWDTISKFMVDIWNGIVNFFTSLGNRIGEIFMGALEGQFGVLPQVLASIVVLIVAVVAIIIETLIQLPMWLWENIIVPIGTFFGDLWYGIVIAVTLMWSLIQEIFSVVATWIWETVIVPVGKFFADLWNGVIALVQNVWTKLVEIFTPIFTWINDNVIQPIARFFAELWAGVLDAVKRWWNNLVTLLSAVFPWINDKVIQPVARFFSSLWDGIVTNIRNFWNGAMTILGNISNWIKTRVIDPVARFFVGLWDGVVQGIENAVNTIRRVIGTIGDLIKTPVNAIIDSINRVIGGMNNIKVPDWVPGGLGGKSPNFPSVPRLAKGGVIDNPTLAIVGEAGKEAVMPLENNTEWIDTLANKLNQNGSGGPTVIEIYLDGQKIGGKMAELINNRSKVTGVNQIFV